MGIDWRVDSIAENEGLPYHRGGRVMELTWLGASGKPDRPPRPIFSTTARRPA